MYINMWRCDGPIYWRAVIKLEINHGSQNRKKSWKPECVGSFNIDWRIKFTNIRQSMLKLKAHSGFHDFFRF